MSIAIILKNPKTNKEIDYTETTLADVMRVGYLSLTYNLTDMMNHLPCKWPRDWENTYCRDLKPIIAQSLREIVHHEHTYKQYNATNGWGTTKTAIEFLANMLILITVYPDAIIHVE